jgi:hypothetical protein
MGQEGEEQAELLATMRSQHLSMKKWYNGPSLLAQGVKSKYGGTFPAFWRDLQNWPAWSDAYKAYMTFTEKGDAPPPPPAGDRKRRSRWASDDAPAPAASTPGGAEEPPKRKSRWARGRDETPRAPDASQAVLQALGIGPGAVPMTIHPKSNGVFDILPGMPSNLQPHQQEALKSLQLRLRVANERLSNLESEAARVDDLPKGHADRSPSPPPGT